MSHQTSKQFFVLALAFVAATQGFAAARPNVIFFLSDDQRADTIAALGNRHIQTPNLDRLVRRGTAFTRACYMGSMSGAVCVPSRAMLMTGRTVFRATEPPSAGLISKDLLMWPEVFRKAGYLTAGIGKWHNDTASYNRAFTTGGPTFFGGMANHRSVPVHDYDASGRYPRSRRRTGHGFSTELFADAAVEFLRERSKKPFVLYVAFTVPHDPRTHPTNSTAYAPSEIPLPPNFLPDHPFDNGEMNVRDEQLLPRPRASDAVRDELARYYGLITHMDAQIGRVLAALAETRQEDNTIVVFAADNGLALGSHGLLGKQNLYEHSVRVPLVLAGPGIPQGRTSDALCYLHDLAPTLCELAGLRPPATFEGISLVPILDNPAAPGRPSIFCAYKDVQRSVRDDQWKLIWYPKLNRTQLFDLKADPHEMTDLAASPDNADVIARLRGVLASWQRKVNDPLKTGS
jgi:arylsulfatase A-like enzyme